MKGRMDMSSTTMNLDNLHGVDARPAFGLSDSSNRVKVFLDHSRATSDLATALSLIGQEVSVEPQIKFRVVLEGKSQSLRASVYEHLYRIGREALLNAFRHSHASRIDLHVAHTPTGLCITVRDNGKGISTDSLDRGCSGLSSMKGRAERIGAKLKLLSRLSAGTEVLLWIPGHVAFSTERKDRWQPAVA